MKCCSCRLELPGPHPVSTPVTRASAQHALHVYSETVRRLESGAFVQTKLGAACAASFNASGSHLAVLGLRVLRIFDGASCVVTFDGLPEGRKCFTWAQAGTRGMLVLAGPIFSMASGEFVEDRSSVQSWESLPVVTALPDIKWLHFCASTLQVSRDLSKVFVCWTPYRNTTRIVLDAHTGAELWRQSWPHNMECMPQLIRSVMAWHPDSDTFFHNTGGPYSPEPTGIWAVNLSKGSSGQCDHGLFDKDVFNEHMYGIHWRQSPTDISVSPDGVWLAVSLTHVEIVENEYTSGSCVCLVQWEGGLVWQLRKKVIRGLSWAWEGSQCAAIIGRFIDAEASALCILHPSSKNTRLQVPVNTPAIEYDHSCHDNERPRPFEQGGQWLTAVSPSGTYIAMLFRLHLDAYIEQRHIIWVLSLSQSQNRLAVVAKLPIKLKRYPIELSWSPDSAHLCVLCSTMAMGDYMEPIKLMSESTCDLISFLPRPQVQVK